MSGAAGAPALGPLPVTVLCGYLGAGKTTRLNDLLRHARRRIAVMVNDFGAVQIDADLIAGATGDVMRLTNGCICCAMDGDLFRAFDRVLALRGEVDHLVIEASGVAEPQRLTTIARAEPDLACAGVITLVCAKTLAPRLADPRTGRVVEAQIAGADAIIVSRADRVEPAGLARARAIIGAINPDAPEAEALDDATLDLAARAAARVRPAALPGGPASSGPAHFRTFTSAIADMDQPVDAQALQDWFAAAPPGLHRAKGWVQLAGAAGPSALHYASGVLSLGPAEGRPRAGIVVLIGVGADLPALAAGLERVREAAGAASG